MWVQSLGWEDFSGGENGNPLEDSCLKNPRDRGACRATVHGVSKSRAWLSDWACTYHLYANLNYDTNDLIYKTEIDSRIHKTNLWLPKGKGRSERGAGVINKEFGINRYTLLYIKQINNKDLLHSTGNYIQYLIINYNGKEFEKVYVWITLLYIWN